MELPEEPATEIERPPIIQAVPSIAPPHILLEDLVGAIRRIEGNDFLTRVVASSLVQMPLIANRPSALLATEGTESGWRKRFLPASDDGRKFVEESEIFGSDVEVRHAVDTLMMHVCMHCTSSCDLLPRANGV